MIVFQPISYEDYLKYLEIDFKSIPNSLISRGDFSLYFDDDAVIDIIKNKYINSGKYGFMGFAIQYCLDDEYLNHLKTLHGYKKNEYGIKEQLLVPISDVNNINSSLLYSIEIFDFYYDEEKFEYCKTLSNLELRRLLILHYYNDWDPDGLLECGAPRDEYSGEIKKICNSVNINTTTEQLAGKIKEVNDRVWSNRYLKDKTNILDIARKIDTFLTK